MNTLLYKIKHIALNTIKILPLWGVGGLVLLSCTDTWDDHYAEKTNANGSLWQAISEDANLSNFKKVVEATGYDRYLSGSQVFTVFAPTNEQLTDAQAQTLIDEYNKEKAAGVKDTKNSTVKEFVMNHIALYNYSTTTSDKNTTLTMMNGKKMAFSNNSFEGVAYGDKKNYSTSNGVLFSINGISKYNPNVYEYLAKDSRLDSLRSYLYQYTLDEFKAEESVPGEIVNGKTQYLDSVTVEANEVMEDWMGALLSDEDSTYWFIAPGNDIWKEQLEKNITYFQYDKEVSERDSFMYNYPRFFIFAGNAFSATMNKKMLSETADSAMSTIAMPYILREYAWGSDTLKYFQYDKPFDSDGIFRGTENITCTNGQVMIPDRDRFDPSRHILRTIIMEAEDGETLDSLNEVTTSNAGNTVGTKRSVSSSNPYYNKVSGNGYLEITSTGTKTDFTKALFDVRNVLSNVPYNVYLITAPAAAYDENPTATQMKDCRFRVTMQCHDADGIEKYIASDDKGGSSVMLSVYPNDDKTRTPGTNYTNSKVQYRFVASGTEINKIYVGTYTFPTCSYNTSEAQVKMLINCNGSGTTYNRTLRLDCIVFEPVTK